MKVIKSFLRCVFIAGLFAAYGLMTSGCGSMRSMTYDEMRREYDPEADGYNYADDYDDYYYNYMGY